MPESFASVTMLYVNVVIHGVPLKVCVSISFFFGAKFIQFDLHEKYFLACKLTCAHLS